jgi:hypothetical protein
MTIYSRNAANNSFLFIREEFNPNKTDDFIYFIDGNSLKMNYFFNFLKNRAFTAQVRLGWIVGSPLGLKA